MINYSVRNLAENKKVQDVRRNIGFSQFIKDRLDNNYIILGMSEFDPTRNNIAGVLKNNTGFIIKKTPEIDSLIVETWTVNNEIGFFNMFKEEISMYQRNPINLNKEPKIKEKIIG